MGSRVISTVLKLKDQNFSSGLRQANKDAGEFGRYMQVAQNKAETFAKKVNSSFKAIGKGALTGAIAGVAALGVNVAKTIVDMDSSFSKLQAQTGATSEEMKLYKSAAKDAFSSGYGESLDEVANAVSRIKQNIHGLNDGELANVTKSAMLLAQTFESDVNEVTRGANNMMEAFGISSQKAFDLFTAGGQRGLNFSNEMFDNAAEYASLFGQMGYSAEEYFGILERGSKNG